MAALLADSQRLSDSKVIRALGLVLGERGVGSLDIRCRLFARIDIWRMRVLSHTGRSARCNV